MHRGLTRFSCEVDAMPVQIRPGQAFVKALPHNLRRLSVVPCKSRTSCAIGCRPTLPSGTHSIDLLNALARLHDFDLDQCVAVPGTRTRSRLVSSSIREGATPYAAMLWGSPHHGAASYSVHVRTASTWHTCTAGRLACCSLGHLGEPLKDRLHHYSSGWLSHWPRENEIYKPNHQYENVNSASCQGLEQGVLVWRPASLAVAWGTPGKY